MAEDTEFARKAQRALEEKEERRIEELKQMEEKMKARAKQGQVSLSLARSRSVSLSLSRSLSSARSFVLSLSSCRSIHGTCNRSHSRSRFLSRPLPVDRYTCTGMRMHAWSTCRQLSRSSRYPQNYSGSITALCMLLL